MNILYLEASPGWGGQEIRVLQEALGLKARGHGVTLVVAKGGGLVKPAREAGLEVHEMVFKKAKALSCIFQIRKLIRGKRIHVVNTHSSLDSWFGGIAGKLSSIPVVRTRHLSTPIRGGLNSKLLYRKLADRVVTTCSAIVPHICQQAGIAEEFCQSIPTGVRPEVLEVDEQEVLSLRESWGIKPEQSLVGTLCILRRWKGIDEILEAAQLLKHREDIAWVVVGGGVSEEYFLQRRKELGLEDKVLFPGYLKDPANALAAMDIFTLLSHDHEGVSQASLKAAALGKPLITTTAGGLPEVCLHKQTGLQVPTRNPEAVAAAVEELVSSPSQRVAMGSAAKKHVLEKFLFSNTIREMESIYEEVSKALQ